MTIKQIQEILKAHGVSLSATRLEEKLKAYELKAEELTPEMVTGWAEELRQAENKPTKSKTGALANTAKSEAIAPTQPEAIAAPPSQPQQQQQPNLNIQPLTSAIHGTVEQMVLTHRQGELGAVDAMLKFYEGTQGRIVNGINEGLATTDMSSSLEATLQQQRDALGDMNEAIANLINNINVSAGVRDAA